MDIIRDRQGAAPNFIGDMRLRCGVDTVPWTVPVVANSAAACLLQSVPLVDAFIAPWGEKIAYLLELGHVLA